MKRRIVAGLMAAMMVMSFAACGNKTNDNSGDNEPHQYLNSGNEPRENTPAAKRENNGHEAPEGGTQYTRVHSYT